MEYKQMIEAVRKRVANNEPNANMLTEDECKTLGIDGKQFLVFHGAYGSKAQNYVLIKRSELDDYKKYCGTRSSHSPRFVMLSDCPSVIDDKGTIEMRDIPQVTRTMHKDIYEGKSKASSISKV